IYLLHTHMSTLLFPSFFFFRLPRPPNSTLFPYTTLFRSGPVRIASSTTAATSGAAARVCTATLAGLTSRRTPGRRRTSADNVSRSEEHTSELQSPYDLVCRLLLEKKKTITKPIENEFNNA